MTFRVLLPQRKDDGWRDGLWWLLYQQYWSKYTVVAGTGPVDGPFCRSHAINEAARKAGDWDVAAIIDGDVWVPEQNLAAASELAQQSGRMVAAFTEVHELNEGVTRAILRYGLTGLDHTAVDRVRTKPLETQSNVLVVPRAVFDEVRGFDERFVGWAGEDNAFWRAVSVLCGEPLRVQGPVYHLWHESGRPDSRDVNYQNNQALWSRYAQASSVDQMRALIAERHQ